MRFAPPTAMRMQDRGGGLNPTSVRSYNERLVISLLREKDRLSRMELGQLSGLSAQTISVIVRALERDDLILRGEAQRGKVGPPAFPMSLNPEGAYSIGIKIGNRNTDAVLVDFLGKVRRYETFDCPEPEMDLIVSALGRIIPTLTGELGADRTDRIVGIGVALPDGIDTRRLPIPGRAEAETWSADQLEAQIGGLVETPVFLQNDVTAAAGAEATFGSARQLGDFAYFFIGAVVESRLVLNHHVYAGTRSRGPQTQEPAAPWPDDAGSLTALSRMLAGSGTASDAIWLHSAAWPAFGAELNRWITEGASSIANSILGLTSFVNIETIIVDGRLPPDIRQRICEAVSALTDASGLSATRVRAGTVGGLAKAIGAANQSFHARFMIDGAAHAGHGER